MIAPLALASAYVLKLFDDLAQLIRNVFGQDANDILDCFQDNYIGIFRHNTQRRETLFPIEIWNMFNRTNEELHRTNNVVEGCTDEFHHHFHLKASNVNKSHGNI